MTYLVTGGWGFIGSRIVRTLSEAGREIVVFDKASGPASSDIMPSPCGSVTSIQGDVGDPLAVLAAVERVRPRYIIHTAFGMEMADYRPPVAQEGPLKTAGGMRGELDVGFALRVNCGGMLNILEAARHFDVKRVVFTSAAAAFGSRIEHVHAAPIGDDAVFAPDSMYGATKVVNEVMARLYRENHGVDSIGLRIARTFGPGNPAPFTDFLRRVALEEKVELVDPDYRNSYIYVDDCAHAHIFACGARTQGRTMFNLREGEYSNRDLAEAIRRVHPAADVRLIAGKGDGVAVPPMEARGIVEELGWRAPHSLDEALVAVINYWRNDAGLPLLPTWEDQPAILSAA